MIMFRLAAWRRIGDVALVLAAFVIDGLAWQDPGTDRTTLPSIYSQVAAALAAVSLLGRRRYPRSVHMIWVVYGLTPVIWTTHEPFVGLLVSLWNVASRCDERQTGVALAASSVPLGINAYLTAANSNRPDAAGFALAAVLWGGLGMAAWAIGRSVWRVRRRAALQAEAFEAERKDLLRAERVRLARELHDVVAHSVSAMILQASGARAVSKNADDAVTRSLSAIEHTGADAMRELHRLLGLLRAVDDRASHAPDASTARLARIDQLLETTRDCGFEVRYRTEGQPASLDASAEHAAYRLIQESLTNVIKYAAQGSLADLTLRWLPDALSITITSRGGDPSDPSHDSSGGFGLIGLRERIALVGGRLEFGPTDTGFVTAASIPLAGSRTP